MGMAQNNRNHSEQFVFDMRLGLVDPNHFGEFCTGQSNREAHHYLIHGWPHGWMAHACLLIGPSFCGKTHLLHLWHYKNNAKIIKASKLKKHGFWEECVKELERTKKTNCIAIEWNLDEKELLSRQFEEQLFHLYNWCKNNKGYLLIASEIDICTQQSWCLPDLKSRLNAMHKIHIHDPDDALLSQLLLKIFMDRQLQLPPHILHYILQRMERSYAGIQNLVHHIDHVSLSLHKSITIPLIKSIMGW